MFKTLSADKDAYITDRVVRTVRVVSGNTGNAATLDLFKMYGITSSGSLPNIELSRLLVHFDLDPLRILISSSLLDTTDPSFTCKLKLHDVYGGQPTPSNFTVVAHPLSRSFDEGLGRDVVLYSDDDVCNFLSASRTDGAWILSGANSGGTLGSTVDYLTNYVHDNMTSSFESSQIFVTGEEDLLIDVTTAVSAALNNVIPDYGFRIALTSSIETDSHTYFVKRFAARHAFDTSKRPKLFVYFEDAIIDDSSNLRLDTSASLVLYNYGNSGLQNLMSASTTINGNNCLILKLQTPISGGTYELNFTGSQVNLGTLSQTGVYSASVYVDSTNTNVMTKLNQTGSIDFTPIWGSLDETLPYLTGSIVTFYPSLRGSVNESTKHYTVSVSGLPDDVAIDDSLSLRVNIYDAYSPAIKLVKTPVITPGITLRNVYYQVRDVVTDTAIVPFDSDNGATKCSSDSSGMFFTLNASNLTVARSYVIDVMIITNGERRIIKAASPAFRVVTT